MPAHEFRTPLSLMQVQLDLYNSMGAPGQGRMRGKDNCHDDGAERKTQQDGKDSSGDE